MTNDVAVIVVSISIGAAGIVGYYFGKMNGYLEYHEEVSNKIIKQMEKELLKSEIISELKKL